MSYFSKNIFYKTILFFIFGSNLKWVDKQSPNFSYLVYVRWDKVIFQNKLIEKNL